MNEKYLFDYKRMAGIDYRSNLRSIIQIIMRHHIGYMYWWRKYEMKKNRFVRLLLFRYSKKYGLEISPGAKIGKGLYLGHPYNITVGSEVTLGEHVSLHKGCTIGRENRGSREGCPQIGNRVWIGVNATVVGRVQIGNDVMICPNSFVNFDVPDHSIVIGNPAAIHYKENATFGYL